MKLTEQFKEALIYCFLLLILSFMLFGCSERHKTPDDVQLEFFKNEIKYRNNLNK